MIQLTLHSNNEERVSRLTRVERWSNPEVCEWLCATQVWTFEGSDEDGNTVEGDAICVVTGHGSNTRNKIVCRFGSKVPAVYECGRGIRGLLEAYGYTVDPTVQQGAAA